MTENNTILIVDDQESIIKSLNRLLLTEPYNILSSPDGQTALEIIREHNNSNLLYSENIEKQQNNIFLIISDQRMPNMTGTQFLEKTVEMLPDTIRFILSGYADRDDIVKALNNGVAHRYLTKPWNNEELLIMIRQAHESPEKVRKFADSRDAGTTLAETNLMEKEIKKFDEHRRDLFLGRVAVHHGFITQEQLDVSLTAMQSERQAGRSVALENILFERGLISSEDMGKIVVVTRRRMGKTFAKTAIQNFGVSQSDIEKGLAIQSQEFNNTTTCRLLGDILVSEKIITEEQKESIIIDQVYSERAMLSSDGSEISPIQNNNETDNKGDEKSGYAKSELALKRRKNNFFRQRALDKIFCKSAINRNFATEPEILKALEEQLLHFTRKFEIRLVKDILVERSIISQAQAQTIVDAISKPQQPEIIKHPEITGNGADSVSAGKGVQAVEEAGETDPFEVTISEGELEATIRLVGDMPEGMSADKLKKMVATKHNIIYGLSDDVAIELFLRKSASKKDKITISKENKNLSENKATSTNRDNFVIAMGKPVKPGRNGLIKYYFENENKQFGKELASGRFDYRDRDEIPNVVQGTILAEKIPPIPAVNGITVRGTEIAAPVSIDVNLDCGQGIEISKNGLVAIAAANGRPDITLTGKISILPEKIIKGNVDFKTGNVKFSGDIIIHGIILPGFSVTGGNLKVNDIEEAEVNITNTVSVKNNINASTIRTGTLLTAQIIKRSTIIAHGDVVVQKEIIDCTIITSGKVIVPRGRIVASTIHAAQGIEAMNIGSEVSSPCHLFPGSDDHARELLKTFSDKIDLNKENLVKLEAVEKQYENQSIKQLNDLSELSRVQERLAVERKKTLEDRKIITSVLVRKQMDAFLSDIDQRVLKMDETINSLFDENDILQTRTSEIKAKIKAVRTEIQNLLKEKNSVKTWYEARKEDAHKKGIAVSVYGTIFAGTQITGTECSITMKNHIKNSKIQQVMNMNDPNNPFHEMSVVPARLTGKMHA